MIETKRLLLRELGEEDVEDFYEIFSSPEVGRFISKMSHSDVEKYFERRKQKPRNPYSFAVILKENNKMIGTCGVKLNPKTNVGTLSYVFNPQYWNNGYCTEACRAILRYCFDVVGMEKIEADCFEDNACSIHILQDKLKMHIEQEKQRKAINSYTNKITAFKFFSISKSQFQDSTK